MLSFGCDVRECRVPFPEGVQIGERATCPVGGNPDGVAPDRDMCHVSSGGGVPTMGSFFFSFLFFFYFFSLSTSSGYTNTC